MLEIEGHTGLYTKIEDSSGNYIKYNKATEGSNAGAFRYYDALVIFNETVTASKDVVRTKEKNMKETYMSTLAKKEYKGWQIYEDKFEKKLTDLGVSKKEAENIWIFINDSSMWAKTVKHPQADQFVLEDIDGLPKSGKYLKKEYLYTKTSDQSRNVDFGLKLRQNADLWLSKDLYKTTMLINGKQEEYIYNKKKSETDSEGNWKINLTTGQYIFSAGSDSQNRANNNDYNGTKTYERPIRKSDYLYNANDLYGGNQQIKNLQVFVTYRIAVKNQSQSVKTTVEEIVDYYDVDQYKYDTNFSLVRNATYVGDAKGNKTGNLTVSPKKSKYKVENTIVGQTKYNYDALYLTGMGQLKPGELKYIYITFKVNTDGNGRVKLDQDLNTGNDTLGKRNIAEITGYSTQDGLIDLDSNPGSLKPKDLDSDGNIISSKDEWKNRLEDDTDKAGNLKLKIDMDDSDSRKISGYVFEDARTKVTQDGAVIGNGVYNAGDRDANNKTDKLVNGVTLQLVELVQNVNNQGFFEGIYSKERIWSSITYNANGQIVSENNERYSSGTNSSRVILSGTGRLAVTPETLTQEGAYQYQSLPPGDFFIRFIYGDTYETVLTSGSNEVNDLIGQEGRNSVSYTGQDYKSTIYQVGVDQTKNNYTYLDQNGNKQTGKVKGYTDYNKQNYGIDGLVRELNYEVAHNIIGTDYATMYNFSDGNRIENESEAKDIYLFREKEINYSKGNTPSALRENTNEQTIKNYQAELLASATELMTKAADMSEKGDISGAKNYQQTAIEELMENTKMVAQTGVINTEVEYNVRKIQVSDEKSNFDYNLDNVNFGLTERPKAQLNISKEVENIQIKLANGQILFDASQAVANLKYQQHKNYTIDDCYNKVDGGKGYLLKTKDLRTAITDRKEELIQAEMDEELMSGATIRLKYKVSVNNIGEVDYSDTQFYYTGNEINASNNITTTNALNILDYVSNELNYEVTYQDDATTWKVVTSGDLLRYDDQHDYINDIYKENLDTYNLLLVSSDLQGDLIPIIKDTTERKKSSNEISLILSTLLSNTTVNKNLIFNNIAELIEVKNTVGRRLYFSKVGNLDSPYQSNDRTEDESSTWQKPAELDMDSAQKVVVNVPTGADKNYNRAIVLAICSLAIIVGAVIVIKKKVL